MSKVHRNENRKELQNKTNKMRPDHVLEHALLLWMYDLIDIPYYRKNCYMRRFGCTCTKFVRLTNPFLVTYLKKNEADQIKQELF